MKPVAAIILEAAKSNLQATPLISLLKSNPLIEKIIVIKKNCAFDIKDSAVVNITSNYPSGGKSIANAMEAARPCAYALIIPDPAGVDISNEETNRFLEIAKEIQGAVYYADYYIDRRAPSNVTPVIDYQFGSVRDDFYFGPVQLFSLEHVNKAFNKYGQLSDTKWAGLYDLRLRLSTLADILRVPQPLCLVKADSVEKTAQFAYVNPEQLDCQKEMEQTAAEHLKRIGAFCSHKLKYAQKDSISYPVEASVVIPVRNREKTIAGAVKSALRQNAGFSFNVLVIQNHSTDKTGQEIERIAEHDPRVFQIVPKTKDLGIGGCWNVAIQSPQCGRYVCQLDSDDLYAGESALSEMVSTLSLGKHGMVVGAYRVVNFNLQEIPPGVVDHREWSEENGRNNLLRVHGIGAPRAFPAALLRQHPFPDVSYGEDYAVALRISRDFHVGRIYKPLYLCRRWQENTDADLSQMEENRLAFYKDGLRTLEILERQKLYG